MTSRPILLLVISLLVISARCWYREFHSPESLRKPGVIITATTIESPDELRQFLSSSKAILHIDVGWSVYTRFSNPVIHQLRKEVQRSYWHHEVVFRRIDLSDQEASPLWNVLSIWLKANGQNERILSSGYGDLIWIQDGKCSSFVIYAEKEGLKNLRRITWRSFRSSSSR
jgi:hypothetical protein